MDDTKKYSNSSSKLGEGEEMAIEKPYWVQYGVRIIAFGFSLAALIVMICSHQTGFYLAIPIHARYSYSTAFKFLAGVDGVVCGGSLISLLYIFLLSLSIPNPDSYFKLFVHDLSMSLLMIAGCAAGTAIGYVGRYGQSESGWFPICDKGIGKFCNKITISVVLSYLALMCYLLLTVMAVLKIKSFSMGKTAISAFQDDDLSKSERKIAE